MCGWKAYDRGHKYSVSGARSDVSQEKFAYPSDPLAAIIGPISTTSCNNGGNIERKYNL